MGSIAGVGFEARWKPRRHSPTSPRSRRRSRPRRSSAPTARSTRPTLADGTRFVEAARALLAAADGVRTEPLVQLEAATADGSVFVVRDGERVVAAVTGPEPTVGLVFYDLKSCLRASAESDEPAKPKRAPKRKPKEADER